jgi:hypothetical protein
MTTKYIVNNVTGQTIDGNITKAPMQYVNIVNGTANDVNATQPFTWTTSDRFVWNGSYEIA